MLNKSYSQLSGFENCQKKGVRNSHGKTSYFFEKINKFNLKWNKFYHK